MTILQKKTLTVRKNLDQQDKNNIAPGLLFSGTMFWSAIQIVAKVKFPTATNAANKQHVRVSQTRWSWAKREKVASRFPADDVIWLSLMEQFTCVTLPLTAYTLRNKFSPISPRNLNHIRSAATHFFRLVCFYCRSCQKHLERKERNSLILDGSLLPIFFAKLRRRRSHGLRLGEWKSSIPTAAELLPR